MLIHLHKQATTPKIRAAIQSSVDAGTVLAERFGVTPQTVYKWRNRDSVEERSHTPHRLQTTLTPAQEAVAVALRTALPPPLNAGPSPPPLNAGPLRPWRRLSKELPADVMRRLRFQGR